MALIKCPECGKEVSDKADACIHCGYPIKNDVQAKNDIQPKNPNIKTINGKEYDLGKVFLFINKHQKACAIKELKDMTGLGLTEAKNYVENELFSIKCPTCGSTNVNRITTGEKVTNIAMFGLLGNKRKMQFHCNNCKYNW